jgi:putative flippase GtrA
VTRTLSGQIGRFLIVGTVGFVLDGGVLNLLVWNGVDPYVARVFSFPPAVTVTWYLNRVWAFATRSGGARHQYLRYVAVQIFGAVGNYTIYAIILSVVPHTTEGVTVAFATGSVCALLINFIGARMLVFSSTTARPES